MADDVQGPSIIPKNELGQVQAAEDAETRATRRELKQSSISDQLSDDGENAATAGDRPETPKLGIPEAPSDELKEQISSPKKKRAHDQLDGNQGSPENDATSVTSTDSAKDRTSRHEPEKKRHRDEESTDLTQGPLPSDTEEKKSREPDRHVISTATSKISDDVPSISFANSAFGQLASGSSGFASLGSSEGKGFASAKPKPSSFASATSTATSTLGSEAKSTAADDAPAAAGPKLSFGSNPGLSPFAGLSSKSNGFGGLGFGGLGFGGLGFGSASVLSGNKALGNFTASGAKPMQSDKAARPFGAPDSDAGEDDEHDEDDGDESQLDDKTRGASPEKDNEDRKRPKLHKIEVDDGEAGEITVVSVRAKMFSLDKQTGWKERGAGMLKINVPHACVEFDESGAVVPGSFDASGLEAVEEFADDNDKGPKVARLILRQDQTHRVILNTAILPAMEFQEKASLKSVGILFTALEGTEAKPVSITMRMSAANSKLFLNEVNAIQRELRGN